MRKALVAVTGIRGYEKVVVAEVAESVYEGERLKPDSAGRLVGAGSRDMAVGLALGRASSPEGTLDVDPAKEVGE